MRVASRRVETSQSVPQYVQDDDPLDGGQVHDLAVHLQLDGLVQVLAHLAAHHLAQAHLHVHPLVAEPAQIKTEFPPISPLTIL